MKNTEHAVGFKHFFIARALCALAISVGFSTAGAQTWGSFETPFNANSPWNSRPVNPVFGDQVVKTSNYYPSVDNTTYSTGVFLATPSDAPVTVYPFEGQSGIRVADSETFEPSVDIPRWPANVVPASGGDGHAEIVDTALGIVHSFWQLKMVNGVWRATQYAWTKLDGSGWGDPAHYQQGARAAGVSTVGGLIRKHEVNDGDSMYRHALAVSLEQYTLGYNPTYVFPATNADWDAATTNYGNIPMGSLLMLPPSYDTSRIANKYLKKIAETLKIYGAYVVDRNFGTPYVVYAEIGSDIVIHPRGQWDAAAGNELQRIRAALRPVAGVDAWLDGNGQSYQRSSDGFNLLSMRGPWLNMSGQSVSGKFDSWQQAVVFPPPEGYPITMINYTPNNIGRTTWGKALPGKKYRLTAKAEGGARFRLVLKNCDNTTQSVDTGFLTNGKSKEFVWPVSICNRQFIVVSGFPSASKISGQLVEVPAITAP